MKPLLELFQSIFGCRHRHMSRVFTIKLRTYRVCFDCGREFELPDVQVPVRSALSNKAGPRTNTTGHAECSRLIVDRVARPDSSISELSCSDAESLELSSSNLLSVKTEPRPLIRSLMVRSVRVLIRSSQSDHNQPSAFFVRV
jgi:hypothetical protein